ncbi:MAG TPA: hypothetical protein VK797_15125 [Tepidisphaeraceae bacterium]|jgi:hypothetical protein|nr:hypothetical protein [Tepidisphaeraceae bacterium]
MTKFRHLRFPTLLLGILVLGGCGGTYSGVQAIAPAGQEQLVGTAPDSGQFTLYRATGYIQGHNEEIAPVWTVSASAGQKLGFRWHTVEGHNYDINGGFHLVAFAGNESRDLGPIQQRDIKYVWAGSHGDVAGYFSNKDASDTIKTLLMY